MLIDVGPGPEMVTDVRVLMSNVAVPSGTASELQFVAWVHSLGAGGAPPFQVPSTACAVLGANIASAPSQTLPSSVARLRTAGADVAAIRIALPQSAAHGAAARVACGRHPYERIPQPLRAAPAALPHHRPRRPARVNSRPAGNATGGTGYDQFAMARLGEDCRRLWLSRHAGCITPLGQPLTR
ncbi:MAG: hypothetical protein JOZ35_08390 [Hyphomicrobiales bacterium]|nr:hypothetical protein [Hyphomicrobiales bacterium]